MDSPQLAGAYPLSPMQQGMLFQSLLLTQPGVYMQQKLGIFREPLDVPAFRRAWDKLLERHGILRTSFLWEGLNEPVQKVHAQVHLPVEELDWSSVPDTEREPKLQAFLQAERHRKFDFTQPPLVRVQLIRFGEADFRFVLTSHHILLDGRSFVVLLQELFAGYEAFRQGQEPALADPKPYREYIDWLQRQDWVQAEAYWKQELKGFRAPTPLPAAVHAPGTKPSQDIGQGHEELRLPPELTTALEGFAKQHNLTLNTLIQAAWALLLGRYSGEEDVVFGATRACRHSSVPGSDSMIGLFINTVPVRAQVNPEKPLLTFLQELRNASLSVRPHEHTPLIKVQGFSEVPRGQPLFENIVVFEKQRLNDGLRAQGGGWLNREVHLLQETDYPLVLTAFGGPELLLGVMYQQPRLDPPTVQRMLRHFRTILEMILQDPNRALGTLPMLPDEERRQVTVEFNRTQGDYPQGRCIHTLFEEQVEKTPEHIAVVFGKQQLTYRELNRKANQLAHYLRARGIGPEVLAGLSAERSLEVIIGLLGVLKAGGGYLPLDPAYPSDRLAYMIEDSRIKVLLTQQQLVAKLPKHSAQVICLDAIGDELAKESDQNLDSGVKFDNLAYVIYTSGSTGRPKGVLIEHRGVGNLAWAQIDGFAVKPDSRLLQFASLSFDASVSEVFVALCCGATLIVAPPGVVLAGPPLVSLLTEQRVSVVTLPPSVVAVLPEEDRLPMLKTLVVAGEACSADLVARWGQDRRFVNAYGPTECTVCATQGPCLDGTRAPSIGRPILNTQIYILDPQKQPVPIGVAGEIYIGSVGIARGYLNRPELTAERFVPNPFSTEPGARLYRTGDLARWLPNGEIEYLGRIDHQVKVRGFRIELGEIETQLDQHPGVRTSVVLARKDGLRGDSLIAYFIPEEGQNPEPETLRTHLKEKLPEYMVPSHFLRMDKFPLTPNGKIDRKALPAPGSAAGERARQIVPPRTDAERDLTALWEDVLKVKPIGVTENFFELGGHSLSAAILMGKIKVQLGHALPLGTLFQTPTVEKLAALLQTQLEAGTESCIVPLHDAGSNPPLFLIAGVGGHVFTFHKFARLLGEDQPTYGVKAVGIDGKLEPPDRVPDIAAHYVKEILVLRPEGPYLLGGYSVGGLVAFETACQLRAQRKEVPLVVIFDANAPGYPKKLPLGKRLLTHWNNFARANFEDKKKYLRARYGSVKARVMMKLGLNILNAPEIKDVEGFAQDTIKKVWAALDKAGKTYWPGQKFDGRIALFSAEQHEEWAATVYDDPCKGWSDWTTGKVETYTMPGSHLEMFQTQAINQVAESLRGAIRQTLAGQATAGAR